jgi:hypothetical protein
MALLEGTFNGKAIDFELGFNKKSQPEVRIQFEIADGPHAGKRVPYSGNFSDKAVRYTKMDLLALGWVGKDIQTAKGDVLGLAKVVSIQVEVASYTFPDSGKTREWSTVRSVGRVADPLKPLDGSTMKDVNSWLASADVGTSETPPSARRDPNDIPF